MRPALQIQPDLAAAGQKFGMESLVFSDMKLAGKTEIPANTTNNMPEIFQLEKCSMFLWPLLGRISWPNLFGQVAFAAHRYHHRAHH